MWKRTIALTLTVMSLMLVGCDPGSNSFSQTNPLEYDGVIQSARWDSNYLKA